MNFKSICLLSLLFASGLVSAQSPSYKDYYEWQSNPLIHEISKTDAAEYPAVIILHRRVIELKVMPGQAVTFDSEHKIIHVNNDAGIERFNKVYIPLYGGRELITLRVRSIDKNGKVTEFNNSNLKELKNVDGYGNFKIFAIEGLSKEGELEYFYTLKTSPQTYGRVIFQQDIPVQKASCEIIFPDRFVFSSKSYNGMPAMENKSMEDRRRELIVSKLDIPALIEEQYSAYKPSLMKVDFKLDGNGVETGMTSWGTISGRLIKYLYDNAAESKISKLINTINLEGLNDVAKLQKIEKYIKTNFTIKDGNNDAYEDLKEIISSHVANERGIIKLYINIFRLINIQPQLVFACEKTKGFIDPSYSNYSDLNEIIFYFFAYKLYLVPTVPYARLGAAPSSVAGTNALFVDYQFTSSKVEYLKCNVKVIQPLDYTLNNEGVKAHATFEENMSALKIEQENRWQGYRASFYRGLYYYRSEAAREEFINNVTLSGIDNYTVLSRSVEGEDIELSVNPENYLKVKTNYKVSSLIEKAGDDYLVSVGKIIGKQSELYQERKRQTDIVFHEISNYTHEIVLDIPVGYKCTGLESIKINNKVIQDGQDVMYFTSDYVIDGNKLTITVNEVYKVLNLPLSTYEEFRKMINSAADFNKVVLVLQPE